MRKPRAPLVVLLCLLLAVILPAQAAAKGTRLIRDAEIENIIQVYATPLFQAAGLNPSAIQVY
ncbi:MAG TPA: hypothetical protein VLL72_05610, partial [Kiloniellales bacterium]|nr:hypothetical protein [Kiloniellales bacterium]